MPTVNSTFGEPGSFNGVNSTFQSFSTAFNNVVSTPSIYFQPSLAGWRMVNGGTLDVDITAQFAVIPNLGNAGTTGGMYLSASVSRYNPAGNQLAQGIVAPTVNQLVWTQALYVNYAPGSSPTKPATTLDDYTTNSSFTNPAFPYNFPATPLPVTNPATPAGQYTNIPTNAPRQAAQRAYADPIYGGQVDPAQQTLPGTNITFQSAAGISQLLDIPGNLYSIPASFRAIALLTAVNTSTKTLTVFNNGVNWGFDLYTPEPEQRILSLLLSTMLFGAYWWRKKSNTQ
jgi:hypothetical protein